ncbi:LysR family transcriptional regulator [Acidocella facilis]|uniref:LysR family transcriptional regulator n=1 Tax=Acidocella facilis TaxID=525 RepID=UPI001F28BECD|nr:LysR family transcriptional regulator [Acidocella facilis]
MNSVISERHLCSFREVLRTGSVRGAAERLEVEPSVVSRHVKSLQAQLGVQLLERRGRGVAPTDAATVLLEFCEARIAAEQRLFVRITESGAGKVLRGRVRIVTGEGFMTDLMRWVLGEFCRLHPEVNVTLEQVSAREVVQQVAQDAAHIGIAYGVRPEPPAQIVQSQRQPVCVIVAPEHPLARLEQPVTLKDVAPYPTAQLTPGFGLQQIVSHAALAENVSLVTRLVTNSLVSLRDFAAFGLGVSFMSARAVTMEGGGHRLKAIPTTSHILNEAQVLVLARSGRNYSMAAREVLKVVIANSHVWDVPFHS